MASLEDSPFTDDIVFKREVDLVRDFFQSTECQIKKYKIPNKKPIQEEEACFMDFSHIKEREKDIIDYIKDSKNWTEEKIHKSVYKRYNKLKSVLKFNVEKNFLIIWNEKRPQYQIESIILKSIKKGCSSLKKDKVQLEKIPQGYFFDKACSIKVQDDRLRSEVSLRKYLNSFAIDRLFYRYEFKDEFLDRDIFKNFDFFNLDDIIIYSSDFKKEDKVSAQSQSHLNGAAKKKETEKDLGFYIHIIKIADLESKIESEILKTSRNRSLMLSPFEIEKHRLKQSEQFKRGERLDVPKSEFKKGEDLYSYFNIERIEKVFSKPGFKEKFLKSFNKGRGEKPYFSESSIVYPTHFRVLEGFFEIHIVETEAKPLEKKNTRIENTNSEKINPRSFESRERILSLLKTRRCLWLDKAAYKSVRYIQELKESDIIVEVCQIVIKDKSRESHFNQKTIRELFKEKDFKERVIEIVNNTNDYNFKNTEVSLSSYYDKVDRILMITLSKIRNEKEIILEDKILSASEKKEKFLIEWREFPRDVFFIQGYKLVITEDELKNGGLLKSLYDKDKIDKILEGREFKNRIIDKINNSKKHKKYNFGDIHNGENTDIKSSILGFGRFEIRLIESTKSKSEVIQKRVLHDIIFKETLSSIDKKYVKWELIPKSYVLNEGVFFKSGDLRLGQAGAPLNDIYNEKDLDAILNEEEFKNRLIHEVNKKQRYYNWKELIPRETIVYSKITDREKSKFEVILFDIRRK